MKANDQDIFKHFHLLTILLLGVVLETWQGTMATWRIRRDSLIEEKNEISDQKILHRDITYSVEGVGGNPKTGIVFYGKGSPSLRVGFLWSSKV